MGNSFAINEGLSSEIATFTSSFLWKKKFNYKDCSNTTICLNCVKQHEVNFRSREWTKIGKTNTGKTLFSMKRIS